MRLCPLLIRQRYMRASATGRCWLSSSLLGPWDWLQVWSAHTGATREHERRKSHAGNRGHCRGCDLGWISGATPKRKPAGYPPVCGEFGDRLRSSHLFRFGGPLAHLCMRRVSKRHRRETSFQHITVRVLGDLYHGIGWFRVGLFSAERIRSRLQRGLLGSRLRWTGRYSARCLGNPAHYREFRRGCLFRDRLRSCARPTRSAVKGKANGRSFLAIR